jgi:hypothetical protein
MYVGYLFSGGYGWIAAAVYGDALSEGGYSAGSRSGETPRQSAAWTFFSRTQLFAETHAWGGLWRTERDVYCR